MTPKVSRVQSERDFERAFVDYAHLTGWKTAHFHDSRRQVRPGVFVGDKDAKGFPDWVLVRGKELIFAELKSEKERPSPAQREWLETLLRVCGANPRVRVFVWRPSDWPTIEEALGTQQTRRIVG